MEIGCYRSSSNVPSRDSFHEDDEEALKWAALEKLPTYNRARKAILHGITGESKEVDLQDLDFEQRTDLLNRVIKTADNNEEFLQKLKKRIDRVSLNLPTIEVRFQNLIVEGEAYMGSRALPSISNFFLDLLEGLFHRLHILPSQKRKFHILNGVSGIINPGRMTLLLGPPGSGKSTLLQALSGKLDPQLKFSGKVTYNGHEMNEFVPQRTSAYISQYDVHFPLLTVRETLQFSARCQGVGTSYDMITELLRREKLLNIKPDPYIDALMKAAVLKEHKEFIATEYILKILGMEGCADTIVGDDMTRGISGGQKKRVTTGEMLVGPVNAFFMDNISTGLDSSTTYQIINSIRQSIHIFKKTGFISLLQPPPETFELFDDIILLSEGNIVYQGPRESVLEFFESVGFKCPKRKAVADFLQEVTSKKDQRHYWMNEEQQYHYISVTEFAEAFKSFHLGKNIEHDLETPFDKSKSHPAALTRTKYGANKLELLKACLSRETILMKRSAFVFILQIIQLEINAIILTTVYAQAKKHKNSVEDGNVYMGALFFAVNVITFSGFLELPMTIDKLPIFYKQRDLLMYPSWAFSLPTSILRIPISIVEVAFWIATTYYSLGYDPGVIRMFRQYVILALSGQMSYALFRTIAAISRDHIVANTGGCLSVIWLLLFSGFIISRESVHTWLVWGIYTSPLMYAQTALSVNEFFGGTWNHVLNGSKEALGVSVLKSRGVIPNPNWYWIGLAALIFFTIAFIVMSALALAYLDPFGTSQVVFIPQDSDEEENSMDKVDDQITGSTNNSLLLQDTTLDGSRGRKGMLVPFKQLSLTFENITYSVNMPKAMKAQGHIENRLMLLKGVSGAFKPGVLTALMGVSGAGKTTLLDVLAGRKNSGYIEGNINISGYPKKQSTFARISGYCEQNDIHSPLVTVYESLLYSAFLRLPSDVDSNAKAHFVEEMMELVELMQLRDALVGFPNVNGLSIEQRKRLTIAVELVANPSIIFMDEPTSGLDARAAAIVMRVVRNTVDTGRTVVCTIHQPSIDIFESFDELILLARGGEEIYVGPIGTNSCHLIKYLEDIKGVGKIRDGYNPATWALEVTTTAQEQVLGVKFADIYKESILFRRNKTTIKELSRGLPGSQDIQFSSEYPRSYVTQFKVCLWKQYKSYWRNTSYTAVRLLFSAAMAIMFGIIFWGLGSKRNTRQEILNGLGAMYMANMFLGAQSAASIRPVLITERTVYYREKAAGMYSALPFALAQVVIEIPCTLVQAIIYGVIVYAMIGDQWTATKFFLNMFFLFITLLYYIYSAMMFLAASPNQESASIFSGVIHATWNLFAGFVIPRKRIAVWWRWYVWICPAAWSLYGMAASQYGDVETRLDSGETVAEFMRDYLGFHYDFIWVAALAIIGYIFLFATLYIYSSKFFNFQKR